MVGDVGNNESWAASNLTPGQRLIWAGQMKSPDVPLYNMALNFSIQMPLNLDRFREAFQSVVDRSDSMRTTFELTDGIPQQVVLSSIKASVEYVDASKESEPGEFARGWAQHRCERVFSLDGILFDTAVLRLSQSEFVWYFNQHHLVTDAWSFGLLYRQVGDAYRLLADDSALPCSSLPAYERYVSFLSTAEQNKGALDYWKQKSKTAPPRPEFYGQRAESGCSRSDRLMRQLTESQAASLSILIEQPEFQALTPHMARCGVIATVLYAYLYRVSGQKQQTIGLASHNRPSLKLKQTLGLFVELFPLQMEIDPDETFASLYRKAQTETAYLLRYAQAGCCEPELHRTISVVLNYITASFGEFGGEPMRSEWLHPGHGDPRHVFRLQVHDFDEAGDVQLHFDFNATTVDSSAQSNAAEHFIRILDAMLTDPAGRIDDVDLLSDDEKRLLLAGPKPVREPASSLYGLVAGQAEKSPDAVAVECGGNSISYAQLSDFVATVASELQRQGVGKGDVVTICMRRSPQLIVSMLAVARLGAVWAPVDPAFPMERIEFILEDTGSVVTLVSDESQPLPDGIRKQLVTLHGGGHGADSTATKPDDPAYIIYTSGSTGRPKGVVVAHRGIVNYLQWASRTYVGDRKLAFPFFSPVTFDLTLTSIFVPLVTGGRVVIYPEKAESAETSVLDVFEENRVDIVKLTPSHLAMLQNTDLSESKVRQLILGGENLRRDVAEQVVRATGNGVQLHNEYGPTEASVGCIVHTFDPGNDHGPSVPIGRPIDGMAAWVLNQALQPCPSGVPGELYLVGEGLALGYHNQPELTDERFIVAPFAPRTRMYRTGDIARVGEGGTLEYLGRRDGQVKIRGVRIETGEVEAALLSHDGVENCVVGITGNPVTYSHDISYCQKCGLPSNYPDATFDAVGVCGQCTSFSRWQEKASQYFRTMDDLRDVFTTSQPQGEYDCLALLSGGKDSTYALAQLVEMGLKVLAFTLDNGYISDAAKDNINRVVQTLGVDHVYGSTPAMNAIFVDSLKRHANVCNGCFKTIYTLSLQVAREKKIPFIVTGLSRGQFFETRLTEELFSADTIDVERIDQIILKARKAYHRVDDAVSQLMDVSELQQDQIFDEVKFIDFYRYCPVELDEMLSYLRERVPWIRPNDTGRSTNCLINDVGIHVHKTRRGYHNYAFPYAWDVRMGHKTREAALDELDDEIDEQNVNRILAEIGFDEPIIDTNQNAKLVAWYRSESDIAASELRSHLRSKLPRSMVPTHYVRINAVPLTRNGKIDHTRLPAPQSERAEEPETFVAAATRNERILADIWAEALNVQSISVRDHFIDLGGDSITAIQIVGRAKRAGLLFTIDQLFQAECVEQLARIARASGRLSAEQGFVSGDAPLTPIQRWFFEQELVDANHWNQSMLVELDHSVDQATLELAFRQLAQHHDALRARFRRDDDGVWSSHFELPGDTAFVQIEHLTGEADAECRDRVRQAERELNSQLDVTVGPMLRAAALHKSGRHLLLIVVHHLAVDAMSWPVLLADLGTAIGQLESGQAVSLPRKTTSVKNWAQFLMSRAESLGPTPRSVTSADFGRLGLENAGTTKPMTQSVGLSCGETDELLAAASQAHRVRMHELLIAALGRCMVGWTGSNNVQVDVETHGREQLNDEYDISRTVGWFTAVFPLAMQIAPDESTSITLSGMSDRLRDLPHNGIDCGLRQYSGTEDEELKRDTSEVVFNYLGAAEELIPKNGCIRFVEPLRLSRGPNRPRCYQLEVNVMVVRGQLQVDMTFNVAVAKSIAEQFAADFVKQLSGFKTSIGETTGEEGRFPLANLDSTKLDKLAGLLAKADGKARSK